MLCKDCQAIKEKKREIHSIEDLIGEIKLFDEEVGEGVIGETAIDAIEEESNEECRNCSVAKNIHTSIEPCRYRYS